MGCVFSRRQVLSLRKKSKIPKTLKEEKVHVPAYAGTKTIHKPAGRPVTSCKGATLNTKLSENILQEYSTLAFLMGGKSFPDPEIVFNDEKTSTPKDPEVLPVSSTVPTCLSHEANPDEVLRTNLPMLPDCVTYEGLHQHGFHLFRIDSEKFIDSVENSGSIPDGISCIIGQDRCVVVFQQHHGGTAYLPHMSTGRDLFHDLSTRLGEQLIRIVHHMPSWYVQVSLVDSRSNTGEQYFTEEALTKLAFTKTIIELGKLTGFPGQIQCKGI